MTNYYVAKDGNDSNPGTEVEPWLSISKPNQELQPRDTVYIKGGTYNEAIEPYNSGSERQKITYKAYPGENVYINGEPGVYPAVSIGWKVLGNWDSKSYIVVDGFYVNLINPTQNAPFVWINKGDSDYNEIRNCRIVAPMEDNGFRGILVSYGDHNVVENNYIKGCAYGIHVEKNAQYSAIRGNTVVESYWSNMVIGGNTEGVIQAMLIENNKFYETFGEDGIQFESSSGTGDYCNQGIIIRKNEFWNNGENAIDLKGAAHILIEENIIHKGIGSDDGGVYGWNRGSWPGGIMRGGTAKSKDVIIRKNILYDNEGAISAYTGYKVYNNDIVSNNRDYTGPNSSYYLDYVPLFRGIYPSGSRISIKNNVIGGHNSAEAVVKVSSSGLDINNNCYFNDAVGGAKLVKYTAHYNWETLDFAAWQLYLAGEGGITGADNNSLEANPLLVNVPNNPVGSPENFDFHLQTNSPCINAGAFLTRTINSGSGTQLTVEDAGYFCDGFGITEGDLIQVGSNSPERITNVDYNNNIITLAKNISWNYDDGVSLPYSGSAPDIGAYEFKQPYSETNEMILFLLAAGVGMFAIASILTNRE